MTKKILTAIITTFCLLNIAGVCFVPLAFADSGSSPGSSSITYTKPPIVPLGNTGEDLKLPGVGSDQGNQIQSKVLPSITSNVIGLTGGLSLLFVIISGIQILTAYGNDEKIGAAKKTLTFALAGLLISILSYAIVQVIVSINFK